MNYSNNGKLLVSTVRIKGERDSWWQDVVRLLSGQGVRKGNLEKYAVNESIKALKTALTKSGKDTSNANISLAISHDGAGSMRGVTVLAFAEQSEQSVRNGCRSPLREDS